MNDLLLQGFTIDWDKIPRRSYLRNIAAFNDLDEFTFDCSVTFFAGENGSGKSTLLEAIAIAAGFNPEGGTRNYSFSTFDSHSELCDAIHISKGYRQIKNGYFLRAESFYNVATKEKEYNEQPGGRPEGLHLRSHGESFMKIVEVHFGPSGLYVLDEPEAALSPQRQLTLLLAIYKCAKEGSQFIIATHSPILMGMPDAKILLFDDGSLHPCSYEQTESYQVTKMFIESREEILRHLL